MRALRNAVCAALLSTSMLSCGAPRAEPKTKAASAPAKAPHGGARPLDVNALLAREAEGLTAHAIAGSDFQARPLAREKPAIASEGEVPKLILSIGSEAPVYCFVYPDDPDPGAALSGVLGSIAEQLELLRVVPGAVEVVREAPVTTLAAMYATETPKGDALGQIKLAFHARPEHSCLCLHDEIGYQQSFLRVAASVFDSLSRARKTEAAKYVEIFTAAINGRPAGFERTSVLGEPNGERKVLATGLALLLTSPTELLVQDYSSQISVDGKDRVIYGRWRELKNGGLVLDVSLQRSAGKRYTYRGNSQGEELTGELTAADELGLPSLLWSQKELSSKLAKGGAFQLSVEQYRPSENPRALSRVEFERRAGDPPGAVSIHAGRVQAAGTLDGQGREQRSEMTVAGLSMVMTRVYQRGEP